jgi:hypothetical protein
MGWWDMVRNGIYFVDFNVPADTPRPVKFFSFQSRQLRQIGTVESRVTAGQGGLAVSRDSRWLLYTSLESVEADLMLVDNFR